jgi:HAD superfamily hydrolase (TIGR01490 family)
MSRSTMPRENASMTNSPRSDVPVETTTDASSLRLALFDLDHTLLPIDSDFEWGDFLAKKGIVDAEWFRRRNEEFFEQYKAGTLDMLAFLEFGLAPLAANDRTMLDRWHAEFMRKVIEPRITPAAVALVDAHRKAGDLCAIVTATNAYVTAPIARRFRVEHLIATIPAQQDGRFTGGVRGAPCFREGKLARVTDWLESLGLAWQSFASSTFYSDSRNDIALLEHVTVPVATNPDAALAAHAAERGWRHLMLFDDQKTHP